MAQVAFVAFKSSSLTLTLKHVERKSDGSFQYRRRIPTDLQLHFSGKKFFVRSLGRCMESIQEKATALSARLDADWNSLKGIIAPPVNINSETLVTFISSCHHQRVPSPINNDANTTLILTSSLSLYLSLHPKGNEKKFREDNERVVKSLVARIGDLRLDLISRAHAEDFRDNALLSQSTATVRRNLHSLTAIVNKVRKEKQLQIPNPFEGLGIVGEGEDGTKRIPFTSAELGIVSTACRNLDDEIRHIVAFLIDTGCRVSEVVGLRTEDVILDGPIPYVRIRPFGKVRTLKTPASERDIPLVGDARWAAERATEARRKAKEAGPWLFPRYASDQEIKATHASATLNKWFRSLEGVSDQKTCHCARHAMRDRLRAVQVPLELQDVIGGWGSRTIGQKYGNGYPLSALAEQMRRIIPS